MGMGIIMNGGIGKNWNVNKVVSWEWEGIRELHGDRYLYPSLIVPGTLIPIPTHIPVTSFKIVPVPIHPRIQLSPSPSQR